MSESDLPNEASDADAIEQRQPVDADPATDQAPAVPLDANDADVAEQATPVDADENEDYPRASAAEPDEPAAG